MSAMNVTHNLVTCPPLSTLPKKYRLRAQTMQKPGQSCPAQYTWWHITMSGVVDLQQYKKLADALRLVPHNMSTKQQSGDP